MTDRARLARYPDPEYQSLQASSYNRASTHRLQPDQTTMGWFADSDGVGFLRIETRNDRKEWVLMEHDGPGCLTRLWTPFFYFDLNQRTGPNVRIYLDGSATPVIDEPLIRLVRGEGTFPSPFAVPTARAGDCYFPIPFARSCRVVTSARPFYYLINYRAYARDTPVESFTPARLAAAADLMNRQAVALQKPGSNARSAIFAEGQPAPNRSLQLTLPRGNHAIRELTFHLPEAATRPAQLRSMVLVARFDGEETIWCPVGDFFGSADSLHPFQTWDRDNPGNGRLTCRWWMPYRRSAQIRLLNLGQQPVPATLATTVEPWDWDERSMHFHARWRPEDIVPGTPFRDWNFIDIQGRGVYVGDAWTVVNPQGSWWGEGDEKIYVDGAWDRGFPTHFGTGTEDYYGWAGGEVPTRRDEFSTPFLANVRVGGLDGFTTGYNICTRTRALDAIPFRQRLVFDMESSFGTDIRNPWNLLGYSAVTFWYARPGAQHNRPPSPAAASRPALSVEELQSLAARLKR